MGLLGCIINVRHGGGLLMVLLLLKDPLELFMKRREFLPGSGFLSHSERKNSKCLIKRLSFQHTFFLIIEIR